jgi:heme-degrading monooxygenase HmoA
MMAGMSAPVRCAIFGVLGGARMFARVSTYEGSPGQAEAVRQAVEGMADQVRARAGFQRGYFLVDQASGKGLSITLWESEQAMQSSAAAVNPLRSQLAQALGATGQPTVSTYEVIAEI